MDKDYYKILGVAPNAADKEIRQAYRDLTHDLQNASPDDQAAQDRLNQVNEAFEVLSDPDDRRQYDAHAAQSPIEKSGEALTGVSPATTVPPTTPRYKRNRGSISNVVVNVLMLILGVAIGFIGRPLVVHQPTQQELFVQSVMAQTRHFKGNDNAPVTIIEFGDFQ